MDSMPRAASRRTLLLAFTALTAPSMAMAQDGSGHILLDAVIITAGGFEQTVRDAPASVTVVSGEELAKGSFTSLTDALREVQGVATTGVANEQDIYIRGLPGQYTLILVDGKRQGTRDSRTNGNAGIEQNFIPPVAAIDRIEIVRGPMSSLYGSDAMGGVINIITKPVSDTWTGSVTVEGTVTDNSDESNSRQLSFYADGPLVADRLGLQVWGRAYDRTEAHIIDGPRGRDMFNLGGRLTWTLAPDQVVKLEAGRTRIEDSGHTGRTIVPVNPVNGRPNQDVLQVNERDYGSLSYTGTIGGLQSDLSFMREVGQRTTASGNGAVVASRQPEITNDVLDAKFTAPLSWSGEHTFVFGGQHHRSKLADQNPGLGDDVTRNFSTSQWALFAEDEWKITPDFALTLGVRYNDHKEFGSHVTPRLYGVWNVTPEFTLKGGVSTGFRAPELRSIVPGYYYTTQQGLGVIVSNPDLKPEESTSYEIGALYEGGTYQLGATVFRTDFRNKIESVNRNTPIVVGGATFNRWDWINVGEARMQGIELTANWDVNADISLRASYSLTDSEQKTGDFAGLPLARTPRHLASLRGDWITPVSGLDAWAAANYHGREIAAGARIGTNGRPYAHDATGKVIVYEYGSYLTVDIGANYRISDKATLGAAVYNLFDREVTMTENNTVGEGRRLWMGLTGNF